MLQAGDRDDSFVAAVLQPLVFGAQIPVDVARLQRPHIWLSPSGEQRGRGCGALCGIVNP